MIEWAYVWCFVGGVAFTIGALVVYFLWLLSGFKRKADAFEW